TGIARCCARTVKDHATDEPAIALMKSRRRIALPQGFDHANCIDDYSRDLRLAKWGSEVGLHGSNLGPPMSALGQKRTLGKVRLMSALPQKRTSLSVIAISALCQKRTCKRG